MSGGDPRLAVQAILERDGLNPVPEEFERLVGLYAEVEHQVAELRAPDVRGHDPAPIYRAESG
jgi:hypothetical protein